MTGVQAVLRARRLKLSPIYVSAAALLPQLFEVARDAAALSPSFTAYVLLKTQLATPIVAPVPRTTEPRHATLVARSGIESLIGLRGKRIGWVSKLSATGYDIPRLYLESLGHDVETIFAEQRFCGSHAGAARALARGEVDIVATHSVHADALTSTSDAHVLAAVGPLPGDVIVAGSEMEPVIREALAEGLSSIRGYLRVRRSHLGIFDVLSAQTRGSGEYSLGIQGEAETGARLLA